MSVDVETEATIGRPRAEVAAYATEHRARSALHRRTGSAGGDVLSRRLFEDWLESRLASLVDVAVLTALLYSGLTVYAQVLGWTRAAPDEWIAYAALNALGAGVILHVAIGRRWPFQR